MCKPVVRDIRVLEIAGAAVLSLVALVVSIVRPGNTAALVFCVAFILISPGYLVVDWWGALGRETVLRWSTAIVFGIAISVAVGMILIWLNGFYPAIAMPIQAGLVLTGLSYRLHRRRQAALA